MGDLEEEDIPELLVCEKLVNEFALITETDTALAQFYLQDRKWDLERSVNDYFEDLRSADKVQVRPVQSGDDAEVIMVVNSNEASIAAAAEAIVSEAVSSYAEEVDLLPSESNQQIERDSPDVLKFVTWNIDGLDQKNLKLRTKFVCKYIQEVNADIVFLQEVIPQTKEMIQGLLPEYKMICSNVIEYFTATLLKTKTVWYEEHKIIQYDQTRMGRTLLMAKVKFGGQNFVLLNSHLESTTEGAEMRKLQLKSALKQMTNADSSCAVIFAGDLNLRDRELTEIGGPPNGVHDVWESCGRREVCKFTWDMVRNDNNEFNGRFKPRARYDRIYLKGQNKVVPTFFGLIGITRLLPHQCFPSDHWGLLSHFSVLGID